MVKSPPGRQHWISPRVAVYAMAAVLVTGALFAADAGYRWYQDSSKQAAAPLIPAHIAEAAEPSPIEPPRSLPQPEASVAIPEREVVTVEETIDQHPVNGSVPIPAPGSFVQPAASPQHKEPEAAPQQRQDVQRPPAKRSVQDRAKARRPAQTAKPRIRAKNRPVRAQEPNVYWERDNQLGFAPQLRKRTCNPATGHMPMQCYYPRQGREQFPAKSVD